MSEHKLSAFCKFCSIRSASPSTVGIKVPVYNCLGLGTIHSICICGTKGDNWLNFCCLLRFLRLFILRLLFLGLFLILRFSIQETGSLLGLSWSTRGGIGKVLVLSS